MKKQNGEGSIVFDENRKAWRAFLHDPTGRRISKRFKDKSEAVKWLTVTKAEIFKGDYIVPITITVGEWLIEYLEEYKKPKIRTSTYLRYVCTMAHLEPLADIKLSALTSVTVQKFYNKLPKMSGSSISKIHKLLAAALKKAVQIGIMKDVMSAVEPPAYESQKEIEIYSVDEIRMVLTALRTDSYYKRYYLFVKLAVSSGARLGELLALRTDHVKDTYIQIDSSVHADNGRININPPKTLAGLRRITLSETILQELRESGEGNVFVFSSSSGGPWNPHTVVHAWKKILMRVGIPHRHFHALRHTHATQLLANGVPLIEVSRRLGHSKPSHTLDMYGHTLQGFDREIPAKIGDIFGV